MCFLYGRRSVQAALLPRTKVKIYRTKCIDSAFKVRNFLRTLFNLTFRKLVARYNVLPVPFLTHVHWRELFPPSSMLLPGGDPTSTLRVENVLERPRIEPRGRSPAAAKQLRQGAPVDLRVYCNARGTNSAAIFLGIAQDMPGPRASSRKTGQLAAPGD